RLERQARALAGRIGGLVAEQRVVDVVDDVQRDLVVADVRIEGADLLVGRPAQGATAARRARTAAVAARAGVAAAARDGARAREREASACLSDPAHRAG